MDANILKILPTTSKGLIEVISDEDIVCSGIIPEVCTPIADAIREVNMLIIKT